MNGRLFCNFVDDGKRGRLITAPATRFRNQPVIPNIAKDLTSFLRNGQNTNVPTGHSVPYKNV